jgi:hypothetical protein
MEKRNGNEFQNIFRIKKIERNSKFQVIIWKSKKITFWYSYLRIWKKQYWKLRKK